MQNKQQLTLPDEIDTLVQAVYDENVDVPDFLQARLDKALVDEEGAASAERIQANRAIIGFPEDSSWNEPARFTLYDEDQPGIHRTLTAQTRIGEDSVVVIPLSSGSGFNPNAIPDYRQA
ncbi:MAG: CRISPR-associated helicase/endonuclease Cas3, partial [Rhodocyclaceae bacterium]|nr:CRISPR-associated helicase/endonuclease Cas3 [Rhodocyclaceae bacterium]